MDESTALNTLTIVLVLLVFYGGTFYITLRIRKRTENADAYMTAGGKVGFGIAAASMTATWIWAASLYASATSGYTYGISGPIHYGLWGALMILFIYPFGRRIRKVAPNAHTLAEVMSARHGSSSQLLMAGSNVVGSIISLMSNFIAGGALLSLLSPFNFTQGIILMGGGVLLYTLWSGFRASALTDVIQVTAILLFAAIIIPVIFFAADFPSTFDNGAANLTSQQSNFFSSEAFLNQGAPFIAAVLAYAIGNQTIAQRLFAVREDLIKRTFITATVGYGAMVIGVGMLGVLALYSGVTPIDGDPNNLIPQMAAEYLPTVLIVMLVVVIVGALSSTADSDLSALSSIMMADVYGQNIAKRRGPNPRTMVFVGRVTMIVATVVAVAFASMQLNILDLLVFVGALWGALVFPVIASFYWEKVTNAGFVTSVLLAVALFIPVRFEWFELTGFIGVVVEILSCIGIGVIIGIMTFGFFGLNAGRIVGVLAMLVSAPFVLGLLHDYATLSASLIAYAISTIVCIIMSMRSGRSFNFDTIKERVGLFETSAEARSES